MDRKSRTHSCLIEAMIEVGGRHGYAQASVERVIGLGGVSRSTFYQHFRDRDECFRAALSLLSKRIDVRRASAASEIPHRAAVEAILEFALEEPAGAKLLFAESLAGGPQAMDLRELTIRTFAAGSADAGGVADVKIALVAGVCRLLAHRLRDGGKGLSGSEIADLLCWIDRYGSFRPEQAAREPGAQPTTMEASLFHDSAPPTVLDTDFLAAHPSPVPQTRRHRVLNAVVDCSYDRSYAQVTVSDVTAAAGISRKAFYELFRDKADAAISCNHAYFQRTMTVTAGEFFATSSWPERIWAAGSVLLRFMALCPRESFLAFVESHAIGEAAVELTYDRLSAFTLFLEEGYSYRPEAGNLPRISSEALMCTMFEMAFRELREHRNADRLIETLPQLAFVVLAPFMGAAAAARFVAEKETSRPTDGTAS